MIFPEQKQFYLMSDGSDYTWNKVDIKSVIPGIHLTMLELKNYWPKIAQISCDIYLLIGGGWHEGSTECFRLNVKKRLLTRIADLPSRKMAHSVIFIPPERRYSRTSRVCDTFLERENDFTDEGCGDLYFYKKSSDFDQGTVYCFGGLDDVHK